MNARAMSAVRAFVAAMGSVLAVGSGQVHAYPDKPIHFIVTFPPGGSTDVVARILARPLSEALGQPVIVENRPGAGGTLGTEIVAKAPPDGYTIGVFAGSHSTSASLYRKLRFDPITDFAPITQVVSLPFFLLVSPTIAAASVKDLIALSKQQPLTYGSGGNGNTMHLAGQLLNSMAGTNMQHVPYKGGGPAVVDLLGGQISILIAPVDIALRNIQSGKLRALAVASKARSPLLPALPTMSESGLPGYEVTSWVGILAPANTPKEIIARIHAEVKKALDSPEVKEQLFVNLGMEPAGSTPEEFGEFLRADINKWTRIVKEAGIKPLDW